MSRTLLLAMVLAGAAPALAQEPSVSYTVTVESPGSVALGSVALRVRVSGGVREAVAAAYHMRTFGAWSEGQSVRLSRVGENVFQETMATDALPNDAYRIEVRVWSDVPPYDPADTRTYARATLDVAVDNPPPTPDGLEALTPATALRVGWDAVETSDRSDFLGYRVLLSRGNPCPTELAAYREVARPTELTYSDEKLGPGDYCVRVASVRQSAVTDSVLSPPSAAVRITIAKGPNPGVEGGGIALEKGGIVFESTEKPIPPPAPALGDADPVISDGEFLEDLPYGPQTVTQAPDGSASEEEISLEAGADPKRTPTLIAGGLILAILAAQLRRFLSAVPRR